MTTTGCPACSVGKQIELEITTKAGEVLTLQSCMRCETRTWLTGGHRIDRDEVLRLSAGDADFALQPNVSSRAGRRRKA